MMETDNLNETIWRSINSISSAWNKVGERRLSEAGIGLMEFRVLRALRNSGPLPMIKIAEQNMITQGWVTSLVDRLEKRGLVRRIRSMEDRRIINIEATEAGIDLFNSVKKIHQMYVNKSLSVISREDKNLISNILSRIEDSARVTFNSCKVEKLESEVEE